MDQKWSAKTLNTCTRCGQRFEEHPTTHCRACSLDINAKLRKWRNATYVWVAIAFIELLAIAGLIIAIILQIILR